MAFNLRQRTGFRRQRGFERVGELYVLIPRGIRGEVINCFDERHRSHRSAALLESCLLIGGTYLRSEDQLSSVSPPFAVIRRTSFAFGALRML